MRQHTSSRQAWLAMVVRRLRPDNNPLRRRSDRAEAAIVAGLLAAFLAGAPLTAFAAGHLAYDLNTRSKQVAQAAWHRVPAVLLHDAPPPAYTPYGLPMPLEVPARWRSPDGTPHTGNITVAAGTPAGTRVMVWADASGRLHSPPQAHDHAVAEAIATAVYAPIVLGLLLLGAGMLARRVLDRCRLAGWEADWSATGPLWSSTR